MAELEFCRFFREMLKHPTEISAVSPSSSALAVEMLRDVAFRGGMVLELGPGTGVFTRHAIARGCSPQNLHLIEMNERFCRGLENDFPEVNIHNISASRIEDIGINEFECVLSGLPILSMPAALQRSILDGIFRHLAPGGVYVQFSYSRRPPYPASLLEEFNLRWVRSPRVWGNLPPATVYRIRRNSDLQFCEKETNIEL